MEALPVEVPSCHHDGNDDDDGDDDDDDDDDDNDDYDHDFEYDEVDHDKKKLSQPAIGCKAEVMRSGYRVWTRGGHPVRGVPGLFHLSQNIDPSENPPHVRGTFKGRWVMSG